MLPTKNSHSTAEPPSRGLAWTRILPFLSQGADTPHRQEPPRTCTQISHEATEPQSHRATHEHVSRVFVYHFPWATLTFEHTTNNMHQSQ